MQSELSLAITPAETDADLEAMIHVRSLVTPEAHPTVENPNSIALVIATDTTRSLYDQVG